MSGMAGQGVTDAQSAVDNAIEKLPGYGGNDAYAQGLHDAQAAADSAMSNLPAHSNVADSLAGLVDTNGTPVAGHGPVNTGGNDFAPNSFAPQTGGNAVPVSHTLDSAGGLNAAANAPGNGVLDTDVAAHSGLAPANGTGAVPQSSVAPSGYQAGSPGTPEMPMSPGMGGGMGGMGGMGGQDKRERDPNTWLQADNGTWRDEHEDSGPPSVLGRS